MLALMNISVRLMEKMLTYECTVAVMRDEYIVALLCIPLQKFMHVVCIQQYSNLHANVACIAHGSIWPNCMLNTQVTCKHLHACVCS